MKNLWMTAEQEKENLVYRRICLGLIVATALLASAVVAFAESTIKVPDNFKETMVQTQAALERCIGATAARLPNDTCSAVSNILGQLANLPATPVVVPPAPSPSPTPHAN